MYQEREIDEMTTKVDRQIWDTAREVRSLIEKHEGIVTVTIDGPMEWEPIISKEEAAEMTKQAAINGLSMMVIQRPNHLSLRAIKSDAMPKLVRCIKCSWKGIPEGRFCPRCNAWTVDA